MADKTLQEKIFCFCGHKMEYDGLETSVLADENFSSAIVSDLEVFLCPKCENKIWVHKIRNSSPLQQELCDKLENTVDSFSCHQKIT
jgi:hypothetical protein